MQYDFTFVKECFKNSGWTWEEWSQRTKVLKDGKMVPVNRGTILRCMRRGRAHKRIARAIIKPFNVAYTAILIPEGKGRRVA